MDEALYPVCNWCGNTIIESPSLSSNGEQFCDILCAKLYNDNVAKIDFDYNSFTAACEKSTSRRLHKIYELFDGQLFEELPVFTPQPHMSRADIKNEYERLYMK